MNPPTVHTVPRHPIHKWLAVVSLSLFLMAPNDAQASEPELWFPQDTTSKNGKPDLGPLQTITFETDEGTWTSLDVSPDGQTIVFDMLGDLYTIPIDGGDALRLTEGIEWDDQPRWSPDGRHIAFISDRDGGTNLWLVNADGSEPRQLSRDRKNTLVAPTWTVDGPSVVVYKAVWPALDWLRSEGERNQSGLWVYHRDGGSGYPLAESGTLSASGGVTLSPDGRHVSYTDSSGLLFRYDRKTGENFQMTSEGKIARPLASPDGRWLVFGRTVDADTRLMIWDLATGRERLLVREITHAAQRRNQGSLPGYAFTPDSRSIVLTIGGKIHRIDVTSGADQIIPYRIKVEIEVAERVHVPRRVNPDSVISRIIRWPRISPDGKKLVFSSLAKLWIMDLPNGRPRRLTSFDGGEYAPRWSPDGRWIAYTTWKDSMVGGHVRVIRPDGRQSRQLTTRPDQYINPAWSPDGSTIAFVMGNPVEEQILWQPAAGENLSYEIRVIPSSGGESKLVTRTRPFHWAQRTHPMPEFTPDGSRLIFPDRQGTNERYHIVSITLDGKERNVLYEVYAGDEAVPSPDGTRLALWRSENLYIVPLPRYTATPITLDPDAGVMPSVRITRDGADWAAWLDDSTLAYSSGAKVFRRHIGSPGEPVDTAATPELITDVHLALPRAKPSGTIAFTDARIVTMRGDEVIERGTIVVTGERVDAVGPTGSVSIPSGATTVDASGKTIIPGLHDSHAHLQFNSWGTYPEQKWPFIINMAYGVTSAMDPWTPTHEVSEQSDMIDAGMMLGPRMYHTGAWVDGRIPALAQYVDIKSIDDARQIVRRLKSLGTDMMKEYMQPRRDQRQWLAQAAREEGLPITAEGAGDLARNLTMVVDGFTAFEHTVPTAPLYEDAIQLIAQSKVHYTPTLINSYGGESLFDYYTARTNPHDDPKVRRFTPEPRVDDGRRWRWAPEDELYFKEISADATKITRAGGLVSLGSHGNQQGIGAQWDLWGHVDGGATPLEAIRRATVYPAMKIGLERDLGTLDEGMLADFLVLDANPLDDIKNAAKIRWVVQGGRVYDAESMTQVWPDYKVLHRFFWQTEEEWKRFAAPEAKPLR